MKTVVGLYKTVAEANKVKAALATEGYASEHITVIDQSGEGYNSSYNYGGSSTGTASGDTSTVGGKIKHFFSGLTGGDDESTQTPYAQGVTGGGALLAVTVPDDEAEETADMLFEHGASDIEGNYNRGTGYSTGSSTTGTGAEDVAVLEGSNTGRTGYSGTSTNATGEQVIPIVEEDLVVGKREVTRGGVRVYSHVSERPVSADVTLRDERIVVDRRPVDREATAADFNTGAGVVELTATGEEAVVGKRSRVVEEVLVGKQSSEHTEQVTDTVRRTEVDVEPVAATTGTSTTSTSGNFGTTGTAGTKDRF